MEEEEECLSDADRRMEVRTRVGILDGGTGVHVTAGGAPGGSGAFQRPPLVLPAATWQHPLIPERGDSSRGEASHGRSSDADSVLAGLWVDGGSSATAAGVSVSYVGTAMEEMLRPSVPTPSVAAEGRGAAHAAGSGNRSGTLDEGALGVVGAGSHAAPLPPIQARVGSSGTLLPPSMPRPASRVSVSPLRDEFSRLALGTRARGDV